MEDGGANTGRKARKMADRLVDAALALLLEQGAGAVTITAVGKATGVSRPTIYRYFPTRNALVEGALDRVVWLFRDELNRAIAGDPEPGRRLRVICELNGRAGIRQQQDLVRTADIAQLHGFMARNIPVSCELLCEAMSPVFDLAEAYYGIRLDRPAIAHMMLRLQFGLLLFPPHDLAESTRLYEAAVRGMLSGFGSPVGVVE